MQLSLTSPNWRAGYTGVCFLMLLLSVARPARAQRDLKDIPDPDPEIERQSFQVADGFEVNLYAADPKIAKPIQMNFDAQGRLWIASSSVYPHISPGQAAEDRVLIVEDADGDGRAEKTTVFADGLLIPTGIEPGDGGAYVSNSTELVHFLDIDGDGRADERRVVLSGFGTEDTHHILHTLRWGMDGMLYFNQSIYIHSHVETPYGVRRLGGGGIWQFRPETRQLEIFCLGFCNPWGHDFDALGQSFVSDGAYGEGVNYTFPGAVFVFTPGATRILKGLNPGSPKHCGLEILGGTHLPEDWRGNMILNDFRGHRVCRFVVSEDGSGFASREQPELIKTSHVAFRPIDVKMGPDGAIYIADWYNPIIQHGEVDFRDPRRDHTHGRIWRVTAKGRALAPRPRLAGAAVGELLEALKSPEDFIRHHAKLVLKERGAAALPALAAWVKQLDPADPRFEHHRLEGLWCYQSLDVVEPALVTAVLGSADHRARAAAVRVVNQWNSRLPDALALLTPAVHDEHPRVRLEAVRALSQIAGTRSAELALSALERPVDQFLDFAIWQAARDRQGDWLPDVQSGHCDFGGNLRQLTYALQAVGSPAVVAPLLELYKQGKLPPARAESVLALAASLGGANELRLIFDIVLDGTQPVPLRARLLSLLTDAARQRNVRPAGDLAAVANLLDAPDDDLRCAAAGAAGVWKQEPLREKLVQLASNESTTVALRAAALAGLADLGGPASNAVFDKLSSSGPSPKTRVAAVVAWSGLDLPASARRACELLAEAPAHDEVTALFSAFLERKEGPAALAAALSDRKLPEDAAKLGVRATRLSGRELPELLRALTQAGHITTGVRLLSPDEMQRWVALAKEQGNAARGEALFRREDQSCLKCHAISGSGGQVGPDLASVGASAQIDYLIDSLLQPNKAVKENYHAIAVITHDGKIFSGIKVRQTDRELVLRNAEDLETAIPLSSIDEQAASGSLMPAGLTDNLTQAEVLDLVRFLSELGKVGPYAPKQARLVRRWQVLQDSSPAVRALLSRRADAVVAEPQSGDPRLNWKTVYAHVAGTLALADAPGFEVKPGGDRRQFVRFQVQATTPGRVRLAFGSEGVAAIWVNQASLSGGREQVIDLPAGLNTVTLALDPNRTGNVCSCELLDAAGSQAQVQVVGGK